MSDDDKRIIDELNCDPEFTKLLGYIDAIAEIQKELVELDSKGLINPMEFLGELDVKVLKVADYIILKYPKTKEIIKNAILFKDRQN